MLDLSAAEGAPDPQECRMQAMDRSPDGTKLIVGGQNALRLVNLEDGYVLGHGPKVRSTKHSQQHFMVADLKYHPRDDLVASCSRNASVVLWHLEHIGGGSNGGKLAEHRTKEHGGHTRAVHGLSWHPQKDKVLLTCSDDGTMKLWDLNAPRSVLTTFSGRRRAGVAGRSEDVSVRSVHFHPGGYPTLFLAGLENGQVQVWDTRRTQEHVCVRSCVCGSRRQWAGWDCDSDITLQNANNKFVRVQAHDALVFSVQWHPTERDWFASSGRDGLVHCWDLAKDKRNPVKSIKNMDFGSSISRVAWRPGYESCLATCAGAGNDYKIHVWDADRPCLPLCIFKAGLPPERAKASASMATAGDDGPLEPEPEPEQQGRVQDSGGHTDDVTGLLWLDEDHLASCSKDGTVRIHEVSEGCRPYQDISTVTPAWSSFGDVAVAGAPIVREWTPMRDETWLKAERRRAKKARQEAGGRSKHRKTRSTGNINPEHSEHSSGVEKASGSNARDSLTASDRLRRGIQHVMSGRDKWAPTSSSSVTNEGNPQNRRTEQNDETASVSGTKVSKDSVHMGAPPLNPATTTVQWRSLSDINDTLDSGAGRNSVSGDSKTDTLAAVAAEPAAALSTVGVADLPACSEEVPEGGWPEQPYMLGYNTDLFEYLAKNYTMTPIFNASTIAVEARAGPNQSNTHAVGGQVLTLCGVISPAGDGESGLTPRAVSDSASAASGSAATPPQSPIRHASMNVSASGNGSQSNGNSCADMASRREIALMLSHLDRSAARSLGLSTPAAAAAVASGTYGRGSTEAERRAKYCVQLGDIAVRDEDELEKAVRWYLAGLAALKSIKTSGSSAASVGGARMPLSPPATRSVDASAATIPELLAAQLNRRLNWARRRHCDGVATGVRHNAAVALRAGQKELANCWQMLQALVTRDNQDDVNEILGDDEDEQNSNDTPFATRESRDVNRRSESTLPIGSSNDATATAATGGTMDRTGLLDGLFGSSVEQLAIWFAERRGEADLQSAVTLLLLVGRPYMWDASDAIADLWPPHNPSEEPQGAEETVGPSPPHPSQLQQLQQSRTGNVGVRSRRTPRALIWTHAYIELLQRHKLDILSIRVAHLSQCSAIQKLNQEQVHFKAVSKCLACKAELPPAPRSSAKEAGSHCNNPKCVGGFGNGVGHSRLGFVNARCGVCRLPVRGPWVWCQGCGHGGHLACYEKWFAHQRLCPTGCNHLCNLASDELGENAI